MQGRFGNDNRFGRSPPVKVGDELDVKIEAIGEKGDGVAKKDGFVLFIPNVSQGDNVKVKVSRVLRKVGFADVIGEGQAPAEEEEPQQEEAPQEEMPEPNEDLDSEDFGEEQPEQEAAEEEAPQEEEPQQEEAPEEEPSNEEEPEDAEEEKKK